MLCAWCVFLVLFYIERWPQTWNYESHEAHRGQNVHQVRTLGWSGERLHQNIPRRWVRIYFSYKLTRSNKMNHLCGHSVKWKQYFVSFTNVMSIGEKRTFLFNWHLEVRTPRCQFFGLKRLPFDHRTLLK